jgi:preprotein translocase subunit SecD
MNRLPLWRYILIVVLIVLGVIYAAPVLYGEDPAIQITTKNGEALPAQIRAQATQALSQASVKFAAVAEESPSTLLIRFSDTEAQLKAQDILQAAVGNDYAVALNLAPRTPKWLQALGAKPMHLGLDLRGGIHFLMEVDVDAMLKERLNADVHAAITQLRAADIRYTSITSAPNGEIRVKFLNPAEQEKGINFLQKNLSDYQFSFKNDEVIGEMKKEVFNQIKEDAVQQNIVTLRNRVNELGVSEPIVTQQGQNQISVDLPGIQDTARAKDMIGKVATVRFQLVDTDHDAAAVAASGEVPFGSTLYQGKQVYNGMPVLLKNQVILRGSSILNATTIIGDDGRAAVSIRAGGGGVSYFTKETAANIGKPLATVYVETQTTKQIVNGKVVTSQRQVEKVISIATIQQALANQFEISGLESPTYAKNLALLLRSGAYAAPVRFVQERLVGPSLGQDNIRMGVLSCKIAALLVIIFMAIYYRVFGLIADLALILNIIFVIAIMSILGATLTLPGLAALVLTVGMAVDANVLINERIREELRNGVSPLASIRAGYDRAFSTIVDANVTTLIVAIVLFALGTGPVQGFAVILTIGLITSMVTAIFFTRTIVHLVYGHRNVKQLSIGIKVPTANKYRTQLKEQQ